MSSLVIKPALFRAFPLTALYVAGVGILLASGIELVVDEPAVHLFAASSFDLGPLAPLGSVPRWWAGTFNMVFGLLLFTAVPRLLYIFIDGRIAVLDEQGITTRSFRLKPQRVLWREINSLDFGPLGVRMATMRGTVNLPLAFGESSIEQVTEIVTWFRSDLFPSQARRFA